MEADVKRQIERLARLRGMSTSKLIEQLAMDHIASIDNSTWTKLATLEKEFGAHSPLLTDKTSDISDHHAGTPAPHSAHHVTAEDERPPFVKAGGRQKKAA